jgi:hypothetical protein
VHRLRPATQRRGSACGPYGSFGAFQDRGGRIGGPADQVQRRPTEKNDRAAIVRDLDAGEIDAVVLEEEGEASRRECRRGGGVGVASLPGTMSTLCDRLSARRRL